MNATQKKEAVTMVVTLLKEGNKNTWGILTGAYPDASSDQKLKVSLAAWKQIKK